MQHHGNHSQRIHSEHTTTDVSMLPVRTNLQVGLGLGDVVADVTQMTGLDQLADIYTELTGKSCGCEARRQELNRLFSF